MFKKAPVFMSLSQQTSHNLMSKYGIQTLMGLVAGVLTFGLGHFADGPWIVSLIPGMLIGAAITGSVHAWPVWIAALANFLVYFLMTWLVVGLWRRLTH